MVVIIGNGKSACEVKANYFRIPRGYSNSNSIFCSSMKIVGIVIGISWCVNGISCYFTQSALKFHNPDIKNLDGNHNQNSHNQKKSEAISPTAWDILSPRIFFLTSPPYQIRLRHEERKGQTSASDSHLRDPSSSWNNNLNHNHLSDSESDGTHSRYVNGIGGVSILSRPGFNSMEAYGDSPTRNHNNMITNQMMEEFELSGLNENNGDNESPSYTPLISARALSNMGKFFEHLRENLKAIQTGLENDASKEDSVEQISHTDSRFVRKNYLGDAKLSKKLQLRSSSLDTMSSRLRWHPPVTRFYRDFKSTMPFNLREPESHLLLSRRIDPTHVADSKSGRNEDYSALSAVHSSSTTQTYDPSWSWTNLGLGKRQNRR